MTEISGTRGRHQPEHKRSKVKLDADPGSQENEKDPVVPHGGYETESEVIAAIDLEGWPKTGRYADYNAARLQEAIAVAGIEVGAYDQRILSWLATAEPQTVEVIASLIERAGQRGS